MSRGHYQIPNPIRIILIVSHPKRPRAMMVSRLRDDSGFRFMVWFWFIRISKVEEYRTTKY
jgi:hypothetical protein